MIHAQPATPPSQVHEALVLANERRQALKQYRRDVRSGDLDPRDVLRNPGHVDIIAVHEFLDWVPGFGERRLRKLNMVAARSGVNLFTPLGELSPRQREWLIAAIFDRRVRLV